MGELTHASFFSGVGGADLGLERAGWRTVSVSEIEPYASSVLARHWPGAPNLGDIVALAAAETGVERVRRDFDPHRLAQQDEDGGRGSDAGRASSADPDGSDDSQRGSAGGADALAGSVEPGPGSGPDLDQPDAGRIERDAPGALRAVDHAARGGSGGEDGLRQLSGVGQDGPSGGLAADGLVTDREDDPDWHRATLWSGGFPCQDLSVAGKRRGFGGERSVLAFAFLALVERHRPPAILLENVPGLLSSNAGRDFYALQRRMAELGYGVAYRVLDAQFFGVPQRRRRVFILGLRRSEDDPDGRAASERAAEVLSVGTRCPWHPQKGPKTWPGPAESAQEGAGQDRVTGSVDTRSGNPTSQSVQSGFITPGAPDIVGSLSANGDGGRAGQDANAGQVFAVDLGARSGDARRRDERDAARDADPRSGDSGSDSGSTADADRVREADGLAGRLDDQHDVERQALAIRTAQTGSNGRGVDDEVAYTLDGANGQAVGFSQNQRGEIVTHEVAHQLTTGGGKPGEGYPAIMVDDETASTITSSFGKSRGVSAGNGGPSANVVYQATGDHGSPTYKEGLPHLDANPMSDRVPMVLQDAQAGALNTAQRDNPETNTFVEGPVVYQGHGSNVGPMGSLRAGNGNETGGVPFMEVAAPLEASDGHHGYSSPRGDGADNIVAQPLRTNPYNNSDPGMESGMHVVVEEDDFEFGTVRTHPRSAGPESLVEADGFAVRGREGGSMAEPFEGVTPALRTPGGGSSQVFAAIPISGDALRGEGTAQTPSPDAEGKVRLRDPGMGVGQEGDPAFTLSATDPGAVLAPTLRVGPRTISEGGPGDTVPVIEAEGFATSKFAQYDGAMPLLRAQGGDLGGGSEALVDVGNHYQRDRVYGDQAPTLDAHAHNAADAPMAWTNSDISDEDDLLPDGLDSHRYRCCGNGVVANVADWIGQRLAQELA